MEAELLARIECLRRELKEAKKIEAMLQSNHVKDRGDDGRVQAAMAFRKVVFDTTRQDPRVQRRVRKQQEQRGIHLPRLRRLGKRRRQYVEENKRKAGVPLTQEERQFLIEFLRPKDNHRRMSPRTDREFPNMIAMSAETSTSREDNKQAQRELEMKHTLTSKIKQRMDRAEMKLGQNVKHQMSNIHTVLPAMTLKPLILRWIRSYLVFGWREWMEYIELGRAREAWYESNLSHIIAIESWWRMARERNTLAIVREERRKEIEALQVRMAALIQGRWRSHLARNRLKELFQEKLLRMKTTLAIHVARLYRGHLARKRVRRVLREEIWEHLRVWFGTATRPSQINVSEPDGALANSIPNIPGLSPGDRKRVETIVKAMVETKWSRTPSASIKEMHAHVRIAKLVVERWKHWKTESLQRVEHVKRKAELETKLELEAAEKQRWSSIRDKRAQEETLELSRRREIAQRENQRAKLRQEKHAEETLKKVEEEKRRLAYEQTRRKKIELQELERLESEECVKLDLEHENERRTLAHRARVDAASRCEAEYRSKILHVNRSHGDLQNQLRARFKALKGDSHALQRRLLDFPHRRKRLESSHHAFARERACQLTAMQRSRKPRPSSEEEELEIREVERELVKEWERIENRILKEQDRLRCDCEVLEMEINDVQSKYNESVLQQSVLCTKAAYDYKLSEHSAMETIRKRERHLASLHEIEKRQLHRDQLHRRNVGLSNYTCLAKRERIESLEMQRQELSQGRLPFHLWPAIYHVLCIH